MSESIESFGKKVDDLVLIILIPCFLVSVVPMFFIGSSFWILMFVNGLSWGFVFWIYQTTDTCIVGEDLVHIAGPLRWEIDTHNIVEIRLKSKSGINHGTWSMDKMDIIYLEKYKKTLSIAPLLKDDLIHKLVLLNPKIKLS